MSSFAPNSWAVLIDRLFLGINRVPQVMPTLTCGFKPPRWIGTAQSLGGFLMSDKALSDWYKWGKY